MAICASILFAASARAVGPEVRDSAGLFSPAAVQQADAAIQKIQKELGKELLIETFAGVPENRKADYSRSREEFFTTFVRERAHAARLNGIYVLVKEVIDNCIDEHMMGYGKNIDVKITDQHFRRLPHVQTANRVSQT